MKIRLKIAMTFLTGLFLGVLFSGLFFQNFDSGILATVIDNQTFASIITLVLGLLLAVPIYERQKNIDRFEGEKLQTVELILQLNNKIDYITLLETQNYYTLKFLSENRGFETKKEAGDTTNKPTTIPFEKMGPVINEDIPLLDKRILNTLNYTFPNSTEVKEAHTQYKEKFKLWHGFYTSFAFTDHVGSDPKKLEKLNELPQLLEAIAGLVNVVQKEIFKG